MNKPEWQIAADTLLRNMLNLADNRLCRRTIQQWVHFQRELPTVQFESLSVVMIADVITETVRLELERHDVEMSDASIHETQQKIYAYLDSLYRCRSGQVMQLTLRSSAQQDLPLPKSLETAYDAIMREISNCLLPAAITAHS